MRIIDKNTDFYDYLQNIYRDNTVTFDRTDSFLVTKELMCDKLQYGRRYRNRLDPIRWILLQVCNTFWLFVLEVTEFSTSWDTPKSYRIHLVSQWKNYNKPKCLINFDIIEFNWNVFHWTSFDKWAADEMDERIKMEKRRVVRATDSNEYDVCYRFDRHTIRHADGNHVEKHIPLLKACGIGNCIDPLDIFLAFEEYFSLDKQSQERTESVGLTDVEKIENHGFDKKTSFRGKQ